MVKNLFNITHLEHIGYALIMQCIGWLIFSSTLPGGAFAIGFFIAREHAQAELRVEPSKAREAGIPPELYVFKDFKYWGIDSVLDALCPILAVLVVYFMFG